MAYESGILVGKTALVTGAGSGLGQAIALGLAAQGARLILVGRRLAKLKETEAWIGQTGGNAHSIATDAAQIGDVALLAQQVIGEYGAPSVLVNAAGIYNETVPILESNPDNWIQTLMINTVSPYLICRAFAGEMLKLKWGRIINISSAAALSDPGGTNSAYATSKVALNHFTRQLAHEISGTGVTANVFHPGEVMTEMWASIRDLASNNGGMQGWVDWVRETGGDSPDKSVKLILDLIRPESDTVNGRFLWIEDGLKEPMRSWD